MHFVVCHVLRQLLVPRHSPCALINLTLCVQFWILSNLPNLCFVPFHLWKCSILTFDSFYLLVWFAYLLLTLVKSRCRCYLVFKNHLCYPLLLKKDHNLRNCFLKTKWNLQVCHSNSTPMHPSMLCIFRYYRFYHNIRKCHAFSIERRWSIPTFR